MKSPELLVSYAKTLGKFTTQLPAEKTFPCVVILGVRNNASGRPRGIEADFLQFVATAREQFPRSDATWPQGSMSADGLRFDGERIIVCSGSEEYRLVIDRSCPVTRTSCSTPPDDFERLSDPDALALYLQERPHTRTPLALDMRVQQMQIVQERTPATSSVRRQEQPLYERSNRLTNVAWLLFGGLLVFLGAKWLGMGMKQGIAVNFFGWAIVVMGAVLIVRRGLDLLFPPSRL